jgi:MFS family permease
MRGRTSFAVEHKDTQGRPSSPPVKVSSPDDGRPRIEARTSAKAVLGLRDFRLLYIGQVVSSVGDGLTLFSLVIIIQKLTGSTAAVATMSIVLAIPQVVVGLLAGVFVDRWDHRRTMIVSDVLRAAIVLGFMLVHDKSQIWLLYLLGFAQAAMGTFFIPARTAIIPRLVPREGLLTANSLVQTTRFATRVVGQVFAGVLVGLVGSWLTFSVDALSFLVSAVLIAGMVIGPREPPDEEARAASGGTFQQLAEGLRIIRSERALACSMAVIGGTTLGVSAVLVLAVPYLMEVHGVRTELLGVMGISEIVGMLVGSGLMSLVASRLQPRLVIVVGVSIVGALLMALGAAPSIAWVMTGTFLLGAVAAPIDASAETLVQTLVPTDARGRVASATNTVFTLASLLSMVAAGLLGDRMGIRNVFYAAGAITLLSGVAVAPFMLSSGVTTTRSDPSTR